jgi:hypothetical protein
MSIASINVRIGLNISKNLWYACTSTPRGTRYLRKTGNWHPCAIDLPIGLDYCTRENLLSPSSAYFETKGECKTFCLAQGHTIQK